MEAGVWILISSMSPSTLFHTLQQTHCSLGFDQNISHAMDVFSVMYGTAKDINMLIEFLPGYLYPNNEDGISNTVSWALVKEPTPSGCPSSSKVIFLYHVKQF